MAGAATLPQRKRSSWPAAQQRSFQFEWPGTGFGVPIRLARGVVPCPLARFPGAPTYRTQASSSHLREIIQSHCGQPCVRGRSKAGGGEARGGRQQRRLRARSAAQRSGHVPRQAAGSAVRRHLVRTVHRPAHTPGSGCTGAATRDALRRKKRTKDPEACHASQATLGPPKSSAGPPRVAVDDRALSPGSMPAQLPVPAARLLARALYHTQVDNRYTGLSLPRPHAPGYDLLVPTVQLVPGCPLLRCCPPHRRASFTTYQAPVCCPTPSSVFRRRWPSYAALLTLHWTCYSLLIQIPIQHNNQTRLTTRSICTPAPRRPAPRLALSGAVGCYPQSIGRSSARHSL